MSREEIRRAIVKAIETVKGAAPDFEDATPLSAIGVDSLDLLEASLVIEQELKIELEGEDFIGLETMGDLVDTIHRVRHADP